MTSKRKKRAIGAKEQAPMGGEPLEHASSFSYLGYGFRADGKVEHAIQERMMREAALRSSKIGHIWRGRELNTILKLRLYAALMASILVPVLLRKR